MVHLLPHEEHTVVEHLISNELATFIGHEFGTVVTLQVITQGIAKYCREHKLQIPHDGRTIVPDDHFRRLFNMQENETVNFFGLHRIVRQHYVPGPISFNYTIPMELANKNCLLFKDELLAFTNLE